MAGEARDPPDSGLMGYALRMVIPMRREFGRSLNVQHFLHDLAYAKEVLDEARTSQNQKLRECAEYIESKMLGPRNAAAPKDHVAQRLEQHAGKGAAAVDGDQGIDGSDEEARRLIMDKYKAGLR